MLKEQPWINYFKDLQNDWRHAFDEGKEVAHLKNECIRISNLSLEDEIAPVLAEEMYRLLKEAPVKEGFNFIEPSDLEGIKQQRPGKRIGLTNNVSKDLLKDKILGAWHGRISGCLLGKPVEGYYTERLYKLLKATDNYPLSKYISNDVSEELKKEIQMWDKAAWINHINGKAPVDDDTNYTVLGLKIVEEYGKSFTPSDVGEAWLRWMPMLSTCTAERVAYRNLAQGLLPPESATFQNPFKEWIGAQIRADFFGYVNPGNPEMAADMAWRDASISHIKNGIYGEMFVAAMLAAAAVCDDVITVIEAGLGEIPQNCRLSEKINLVINLFKSGATKSEVFNKIHTIYNEKEGHDWCHTISNAMIVVYALLFGHKDFEKSICMSVEACFDTDCNGATVGSVLGMMIGAKNIPEYWTKPYNNQLMTTIEEYNLVNLNDLADKTIELIERKD